MTLPLRLSSIREECQRIIELGEKATGELLPCPFCGAKAIVVEFNKRIAVNCENRFCWGQQKADKEKRAEIIAAWNSRNFSPKAAQAMLGMMDALENIAKLGNEHYYGTSTGNTMAYRDLAALCDQWEAR